MQSSRYPSQSRRAGQLQAVSACSSPLSTLTSTHCCSLGQSFKFSDSASNSVGSLAPRDFSFPTCRNILLASSLHPVPQTHPPSQHESFPLSDEMVCNPRWLSWRETALICAMLRQSLICFLDVLTLGPSHLTQTCYLVFSDCLIRHESISALINTWMKAFRK